MNGKCDILEQYSKYVSPCDRTHVSDVVFSVCLGQIDTQDTEISNLESQLGLTKADCRDLQNQMSLINSLFTQMLLGATSADMDLDRLTQLLQVLENYDMFS